MKLQKNKSKIIINLIFLMILLTGLFLRLYGINDKSYWLDEETSIIFANKEPNELIKNAQEESHPPLYHIFLRYWIRVFGDSEASTRSLSVLFGVVAIFMMYKIGKLLFNKEVGLLSSLILALSAFHIKHSQETRMYSLMVMLAIISMYFFIKIIQEKRVITNIWYLISSALLIYSHIYGLFIVLAQNIYVISLWIFSRKNIKVTIKKWILLQSILVVVFIPWIIVLLQQILRIPTGEFENLGWLTTPTIITLLSTFGIYTYYRLLILFLFLILAFGSFFIFKKIKRRIKWSIDASELRNNSFLVIWLLTPILIPFLISKIIVPMFYDRYTIAASIALYILAANGARKIGNKYAKIITIMLIIILSLTSVVYYFNEEEKEPWRDIANYIDENAKENELVIVIPHYARHNLERYSKRDDITIVGKRNIIPSDPDRVWFIVRYEEFDETIENYRLLEEKEYGDLVLYLYEKHL